MPLVRAEIGIATEWRDREYTSDPPRYVPFLVWSLHFQITCEIPIRSYVS